MECEVPQEKSAVHVLMKTHKPGIIYLNYVPRYMTVKKVREHFSEFGEVKRMFLKPDKPHKLGKPSKFFSEGWVEFSRRKIAKRVAESLNGIQVGGRRHTPYYDALWSIKYLPKLQWSQLNEGEAYKKAKKEHRMRAEIAKVKREVNFYTQGIEKMKYVKDKKNILSKDMAEKHTKSLEISQKQEQTKDIPSDNREKLLLRKIFGTAQD